MANWAQFGHFHLGVYSLCVIFQPKYNVCPTLEIDVNLTLGSDVNPIFIFNQNTTSVQRWRLTSI